MKAIEKHDKEVFARWRKLIKSVLIKARLEQEYGKKDDKTIEDKWSKFNQNASAESDVGGGFLPDDDDEEQDLGGGFLIDDEEK